MKPWRNTPTDDRAPAAPRRGIIACLARHGNVIRLAHIKALGARGRGRERAGDRQARRREEWVRGGGGGVGGGGGIAACYVERLLICPAIISCSLICKRSDVNSSPIRVVSPLRAPFVSAESSCLITPMLSITGIIKIFSSLSN